VAALVRVHLQVTDVQVVNHDFIISSCPYRFAEEFSISVEISGDVILTTIVSPNGGLIDWVTRTHIIHISIHMT
jgi:hypothetical protein